MRANTNPSPNEQKNRWTTGDKSSNKAYPRSAQAGEVGKLGNCAYGHRRNHRASECRRRTWNYCRHPWHDVSEYRLKQRHEEQYHESVYNSTKNAVSSQRAQSSQAQGMREDDGEMASSSIVNGKQPDKGK